MQESYNDDTKIMQTWYYKTKPIIYEYYKDNTMMAEQESNTSATTIQ